MTTISRVRSYFLRGGKLTACKAARLFLTPDLRKYVSDFRKDGIPITDKWEVSKNGKRYKIYWLAPGYKEQRNQGRQGTPAVR